MLRTNLSIVHVGDAAPQANVAVTNTGGGALNDALLLSFASASSGLTGSSNLGPAGLGGGQTNSAALTVAMNTGPADLLDGTYQFLDPFDFGESGFDPFLNLAAQQLTGPLTLSFNTVNLGSFSDTIVLHGLGHNASNYSGAVGDVTLIVEGTVRSGGTVPEPGTRRPRASATKNLTVAYACLPEIEHKQLDKIPASILLATGCSTQSVRKVLAGPAASSR